MQISNGLGFNCNAFNKNTRPREPRNASSSPLIYSTRLLHHTDVMAKLRRKSLFCEGVRNFVPHLARLKNATMAFFNGLLEAVSIGIVAAWRTSACQNEAIDLGYAGSLP